MAEFKNINSFDLVTPNATTSKSMYLQVNDTQRVSVEGIAKLAQSLYLSGWSNAAVNMPITASTTLMNALKKLAGVSKNQPFRVVSSNDNRGIALCMGGFGIYIYIGLQMITMISG